MAKEAFNKRKTLFDNNMNLEMKMRLKCCEKCTVIWKEINVDYRKERQGQD